MKFLQIKQDGEFLKTPQLLELNSETGLFFDGTDIRIFNEIALADCETVCSLTDCYQSRPLFEVNQVSEFDIIQFASGFLEVIKARVLFANALLWPTCKNLGSIFLPENQEKYPELYQQAINLIQSNQP